MSVKYFIESTMSYPELSTSRDVSSQSLSQYQPELESLRQEIRMLKQEKQDLEILLENTIDHSDTVENLFHESNRQLRAEVLERKQVEKKTSTLDH
ncbi:hypothetical protein BI308_20850 [Roseofilum reptotaenium AO1-A]|uniref:Uncharacterized protein n=2 Tax=Roseofilum TaxID=1233426 RepID=A0A1L9QLV4_9CYAN|nr:hypothetical protein BI308_20850 [Roseofilum reptotaenium AO1-A]